MMQAHKKTALVSGAGRGIGRAAAMELAKRGCRVCLHYNTSAAGAEEAAARIRSLGGEAVCLQAELSDAASVRALAERLTQYWGCPDILVNNAGISRIEMFQDTTDEGFDAVMNANLRSAVLLTKAFLPAMIDRKSGSIVNVSSMWGQVGASCESLYSASKGAVISLTRALAKELGPSGIRVNCVAPGCIRTAMMAEFPPDVIRELEEETPLGRMGEPEEAARAIAFLAGDEASYITGQVLGVNGGMVI